MLSSSRMMSFSGLVKQARSGLGSSSVMATMLNDSITIGGQRSISGGPAARALTAASLNENCLKMEYAVRGELVLKSLEYQKQLQRGEKLPFKNIISCNIGNPHSLNQKAITFPRQVLALVNLPDLLDSSDAEKIFPKDVRERARKLIGNIPGGTGAYSHSKGVEYIRKEVADFIEKRDGYPSDPEHIFITDGASQAVQTAIRAMLRDENDAILVPIPQYPLYSASIALNGGTLAGYYLDEGLDWATSIEELTRATEEARKAGKTVRGLVVINPGNPTGQCLSKSNMKTVVEFCEKENLVLMADEVYQENIWSSGAKFHSFKEIVCEMNSQVELLSFHSVSKGFFGECGRRGGYVEMHNIDPEVIDIFYKLVSVNLCSNLEGQIMVSMMVNPPAPGDASYPKYEKERDGILQSLQRRAEKLVAFYNTLENVTCREAQGALYTFPRIKLPAKAVEAALAINKVPDTFYCLDLLAATGVVVVPGSGFGQEDGTWHFRSTILPPEDQIDDYIERMRAFHEDFMNKYRD